MARTCILTCQCHVHRRTSVPRQDSVITRTPVIVILIESSETSCCFPARLAAQGPALLIVAARNARIPGSTAAPSPLPPSGRYQTGPIVGRPAAYLLATTPVGWTHPSGRRGPHGGPQRRARHARIAGEAWRRDASRIRWECQCSSLAAWQCPMELKRCSFNRHTHSIQSVD